MWEVSDWSILPPGLSMFRDFLCSRDQPWDVCERTNSQATSEDAWTALQKFTLRSQWSAKTSLKAAWRFCIQTWLQRNATPAVGCGLKAYTRQGKWSGRPSRSLTLRQLPCGSSICCKGGHIRTSDQIAPGTQVDMTSTSRLASPFIVP